MSERSWYCFFGFVIGVARMRLDVMSDSFWDFGSRFIHKTYTPETFSSLRLTALTDWQVPSTWWIYVFKTAISMMYNTILQYHSPLYMHQNSINFCVYAYHNFITQNKMYEFKSVQILAKGQTMICKFIPQYPTIVTYCQTRSIKSNIYICFYRCIM